MNWFFVVFKDETYEAFQAKDMDEAFEKGKRVAEERALDGQLSFEVRDQSGEHSRHFMSRWVDG